MLLTSVARTQAPNCLESDLSLNLLLGGGLVAKSCLTLATLWTVARQAPLSMGFFQARMLEWVAISSSGDLPDPGIEPVSPALAGRFSVIEPPGRPPRITWKTC